MGAVLASNDYICSTGEVTPDHVDPASPNVDPWVKPSGQSENPKSVICDYELGRGGDDGERRDPKQSTMGSLAPFTRGVALIQLAEFLDRRIAEAAKECEQLTG